MRLFHFHSWREEGRSFPEMEIDWPKYLGRPMPRLEVVTGPQVWQAGGTWVSDDETRPWVI